MIVGNSAPAVAYARQFPKVGLLFGPSGVGKWTLVEEVRRARGIFEPDVLRVRRLTLETAREVLWFLQTHPSTPAGKIALVDTDKGTEAAFNALLKSIEEIGDGARVALISSRLVPETVRSRCDIYRFGLLSDQEVATVLQSRRGMSQTVAERLARASGGQVSRAMDLLVQEDEKARALAAVRAVRDIDPDALLRLADTWTDETTSMLVTACSEGVSEVWRVYSPNELSDVSKAVLLRMMMVLRKDVRPRLVVRSSLMSVVREAQP